MKAKWVNIVDDSLQKCKVIQIMTQYKYKIYPNTLHLPS